MRTSLRNRHGKLLLPVRPITDGVTDNEIVNTCSCGATLDGTSLRCAACGKKFTVDAHQSGATESDRAIDWDAEFEKLTAGQLRPARVEVTPEKLSWWKRFFNRN